MEISGTTRPATTPKSQKPQETPHEVFLRFLVVQIPLNQPTIYLPAFRSFQFRIVLNPWMNEPCVCHRQKGRFANITTCP
jgi:hypothetical protein